MKKTIKEKEIKKEEQKLEEAFVLWKHESNNGICYLSGNTSGENAVLKLVGFFNNHKKNPKEPDVRIYTEDENGKQDKEICSLWENTSKNGNKYLSGTTDENEKIIAFYNELDENSKIPFIRAYYKEV